MATIFMRIREMMTAQAHHNLDQVENPHVMAQQVLRDLADDVAACQRALVMALGAERQLEQQPKQFRADATDWQTRAERLLKAGDENKARLALERAMMLRQQADSQERPLETARRATHRLREQHQRLNGEYEHARGRAAMITANQTAAAAIGTAQRANDAFSKAMERSHRMDTLSRRAAQFECEADAAAELLNERESLDREVERMDRSVAVDEAMAQLKSKLAAQPK